MSQYKLNSIQSSLYIPYKTLWLHKPFYLYNIQNRTQNKLHAIEPMANVIKLLRLAKSWAY